MSVRLSPEPEDQLATAQPCVLVPPRHVAIIMDGNGRWAKRRGLPRFEGHRRGVEAVRRSVKTALELGVEFLTMFSFSNENWSRPAAEIAELMGLLRRFIRRDLADLHAQGVRVRIIGERESLSKDLVALLGDAERITQNNTRLVLTIAFNYGGRQEIVRAAQRLIDIAKSSPDVVDRLTTATFGQFLDAPETPDADLLIRTSGEMRLSNFLLWQMAYTELVFLPVLWPDFDKQHFIEAVTEFHARDRRFGGISAAVSL